MSKVTGQRLPFQEQIDFLKQKVRLPTARYDELSSEQHDRAFVVAGAMKADLLADLHNAVKQAVEQGQAFHQFQSNFDEILAKKGWLNDETKGYKAWRAKIIYQTNLRTSHMAGRYQQMTDPDVLKERPYWRYKHNTVENPRIEHKHWDDLVLPADSPFWRRNYPPNGYGCRCTVEAINERQLKAMGKTKPDDLPKDYITADPRDDFTTATGATWFPELERYPTEIAKKFVADNIRDGVFVRWLKRIEQQPTSTTHDVFPVAVLSERQQKLLNTSSSALMIAEQDVIKGIIQRDKNSNFEVNINARFLFLQELLDTALLIVQNAKSIWILGKNSDGKQYLAEVYQQKQQIFLSSYQLNQLSIDEIKAKGKLIFEQK